MSVESSKGPRAEIENLLMESRRFPPDPAFVARANATAALYEEAERDYVAFWERLARERISWYTPFDRTLEWDLPFAKWFTGGELNISYNCVDRHVERGLGDKVAYHWIGEPGDTRTLTYADLLRDVGKAANALKELGVRKGDRVAIYMPMIPELPIAMLACARIGAPHTVVFGGFSAEALAGRINDAEAKVLITADGGWRRGKAVGLKQHADDALVDTPSVESVLVVRRLGDAVYMLEGRDHWWHEVVERQPALCPPTPVESEHMLYLLYTSGTTAKPKGIVHTTAGYLVGTSFTHETIFDVKPDDVFWCAADIGWVTGHSYIVYGPLANATTSILYEGAPDTPAWDRWWRIVEDYKVTILYCAPTAIRAFMKQGEAWPQAHDLSSLRLLGSVGEPINPEAWLWYHEHVGGGKAPIVDTWWQTETGMILITPLPGVTTTKPGSATFPFPGVEADVVDGDGRSVPFGGGGYLVLKRPWPAMLRGIYGDPERYRQTYWSRFPGMYFTGDGAKRDDEGYFWLLGRVDDVMNVAGHRISTTEVESALVDHRSVAEAAVVGKSDAVTGQAIFAYVILKAGQEPSEALALQLREHVAHVIGPIARPRHLLFTPDLPKTRSGKIMRRLLRDLAEGRVLGDTTTLADAMVVDSIRAASGRGEDE
ncbi:MAG: acetate/CoA ligase, acetyl-CoA synthetase [Chloroflexi bacterium CSP1-4]|nr:MAG: acetate/CoA ligase, acetyl-CoA synthetase [Chloroflexi bacterium CSP1-4]